MQLFARIAKISTKFSGILFSHPVDLKIKRSVAESRGRFRIFKFVLQLFNQPIFAWLG